MTAVPKWDVTASCRAAGEVATAGQTVSREKSCFESENKTREKLVADWSTFPADERTRCIKSVEWFSPTYTELAACLVYSCGEMADQARAIANRQHELAALMQKAETDAGGRFVSAQAYQPEYNLLRGRMDQLRKTAAEKNCNLSAG